jgi:hypothetical protein
MLLSPVNMLGVGLPGKQADDDDDDDDDHIKPVWPTCFGGLWASSSGVQDVFI